MAGNKIGGLKAAATNKKRYGEQWFKVIGALGGKNGHTGGYASRKVGRDGLTGKQRASRWGAVGGRISRRRKADGDL